MLLARGKLHVGGHDPEAASTDFDGFVGQHGSARRNTHLCNLTSRSLVLQPTAVEAEMIAGWRLEASKLADSGPSTFGGRQKSSVKDAN